MRSLCFLSQREGEIFMMEQGLRGFSLLVKMERGNEGGGGKKKSCTGDRDWHVLLRIPVRRGLHKKTRRGSWLKDSDRTACHLLLGVRSPWQQPRHLHQAPKTLPDLQALIPSSFLHCSLCNRLLFPRPPLLRSLTILRIPIIAL